VFIAPLAINSLRRRVQFFSGRWHDLRTTSSERDRAHRTFSTSLTAMQKLLNLVLLRDLSRHDVDVEFKWTPDRLNAQHRFGAWDHAEWVRFVELR
jgi:hypothetical protein